jgi:N-acetylmuramoyl-L-alanine amidase
MDACAHKEGRPPAGSQFCLGGGSRTPGLIALWLVVTLIAGLFAGALFAAPAPGRREVQSLRVLPPEGAGGQRIEVRLTGPADHQVFTLAGPDRVVIDIARAAMGRGAMPLPAGNGLVRQVRAAHRPDGSVRLVLDVAEPLRAESRLAPDPAGARLVVFLGAARAAVVPEPAPAPIPAVPVPAVPATAAPAPASVPAVASPPRPPAVPAPAREIVIAVDPGHGGHDPGAHGPRGLLEKNVTLAISRKLVELIEAEPGMRGMLTRRGDQFVVLRQRMERARAANADLFVSIHADAVRNRAVRGATVYVLNEKGATDEAARRLAARENAADLIGGVHLGDKDPVLASVLMDLSQNASLSASIAAGDAILDELARVGALLRPKVQQAPFMVLKSPDVPSVLVETAFISNPVDEQNLASPQHQEKLARAILAGIRQYFAANPPRAAVLTARAGD